MTIEDRQVRKVLLVVLAPALIFIAVMFLTETDASIAYTDATIAGACKIAVAKAADWKYLVLHHSDSPSGNAAQIDRIHREEEEWDGCGYHFVIGNGLGSRDGEIEASHRWLEQRAGAHAGSKEHNLHGIGICLVGRFMAGNGPTHAQYDSLLRLCVHLMQQFNIPLTSIKRHSDVRATECPGDSFPFDTFVVDLGSRLAKPGTPGGGTAR